MYECKMKVYINLLVMYCKSYILIIHIYYFVCFKNELKLKKNCLKVTYLLFFYILFKVINTITLL